MADAIVTNIDFGKVDPHDATAVATSGGGVVTKSRMSAIVVTVALVFLSRSVSAEPLDAPAPAGGSTIQGPTNPPGPPVLGRDSKAARIGGKVLLVVGSAALVGGLIMAHHYKQGIGACSADGCQQENVRTPLGLGIATGGGVLAMVGACIWLSVPDANTSVGLGPSSVVLAGRF